MSIKNTLLVGATVITLATGATAMLTAKPADLPAERRQQQIEELADADEASKNAQKESGDDAAEADRRQKLKPVVPTTEPNPEPKPKPKPRPKIRLR